MALSHLPAITLRLRSHCMLRPEQYTESVRKSAVMYVSENVSGDESLKNVR